MTIHQVPCHHRTTFADAEVPVMGRPFSRPRLLLLIAASYAICFLLLFAIAIGGGLITTVDTPPLAAFAAMLTLPVAIAITTRDQRQHFFRKHITWFPIAV